MSILKRIYLRIPILLLVLISFQNVYGQKQSKEYCDNLIKSSVNYTYSKNYAKSLEMLNEAKDLAETNNWIELHFLAVNNIGVVYSEMLDYGEALNHFFEAYKISQDEENAFHEQTAMINIGLMYFKDGKMEESLSFLKKVNEKSISIKDTLSAEISAINLAILYNKKNDPQTSERYLNMASSLAKGNKSWLYINLARAEGKYLEWKLYDAEQLAINAMNNAEKMDDKGGKMDALLLLIKIYIRQNNTDKATRYANIAFSSGADIKNKIDIYNLLSEISYNEQQYSKAVSYKDSVILAKDSLNEISNLQFFENSRIKFELYNYQKDLEYSKKTISQERIVFVLVLAIAFLFIWAVYNHSLKEKQRKLIAERNQKIMTLELEQEKNNKILLENKLKEKEALALLEQERFNNEQELLRNQIDAKNRELTTKAMYISNKVELIENLYNTIQESPVNSPKDTLINYILQIKDQLKNESEQYNFLSYFEEVNPSFVKSLKSKHSGLTLNDVRFLSYVYMGLSTKEISSLLNITVDSCKKKKNRISAKLELKEGAVSLYRYLSDF